MKIVLAYILKCRHYYYPGMMLLKRNLPSRVDTRLSSRVFVNLDVRAPEIVSCPQHITIDNKENEAYALVKLTPRQAIDNDKTSKITQSVHITMAG